MQLANKVAVITGASDLGKEIKKFSKKELIFMLWLEMKKISVHKIYKRSIIRI